MDPSGGPEPDGGGFTAFLYLTIGAAVLAIALALVGLGVLASDPRAERVFGAASRFFRATYQGQFTPAARALREAGCQQAAVLPAAEARILLEALGTDGEAGFDLDDGPIVQCRSILPAGGDRCAEMARVAAGASEPVPTSLLVTVEGIGACRGIYAPDGTLIRSLDPEP